MPSYMLDASFLLPALAPLALVGAPDVATSSRAAPYVLIGLAAAAGGAGLPPALPYVLTGLTGALATLEALGALSTEGAELFLAAMGALSTAGAELFLNETGGRPAAGDGSPLLGGGAVDVGLDLGAGAGGWGEPGGGPEITLAPVGEAPALPARVPRMPLPRVPPLAPRTAAGGWRRGQRATADGKGKMVEGVASSSRTGLQPQNEKRHSVDGGCEPTQHGSKHTFTRPGSLIR